MQTATTNTFLKFVPLSDFNLWDVKRYNLSTQLNFDNVVRLSDILIPYKKSVNKEELIKNKWRIIAKINFGGELFLRAFEEIHTYKGNLNLVPDDAIIYSKINVRHGCIYYNEKGNIPFGVSSEYPVFIFDKNKVSGKFLQKLLRTDAFKSLLNTKTSGISKARVKQDEFLNIQIPLPSLKKQEQIVNTYYYKIHQAGQLEEQAKNLEKQIESYLFDELGIAQSTQKVQKGILSTISFNDIDRWGVEYNLGVTSHNLLESVKYPNKKLKELVLINPTTVLPKEQESKISFIPMECISDEYGEVIELREKKVKESKGYTKFKEGDLIWARITPCMQNGKSAIISDLENGVGVGSTEFHVIRNLNPEIHLEYIYHLLRLDIVLQNAMSHFTGSAGQQRVPKSFLEELSIPLSSVEKQREISQELNKLKEMKKRLKSNAEILKQLANEEFEKAIFN